MDEKTQTMVLIKSVRVLGITQNEYVFAAQLMEDA